MPSPDEIECPIYYQDTYPSLLENFLGVKVINRGRRSNTTKEQIIDQFVYDDILFLNSRFIIIHLGICDCAPRLFSKRFGKYFVNNIRPKIFQRKFIKFFSDNRYLFTKYFLIQDVNRFDFKKYLDFLLETIVLSGSEPILINIAQTSAKNESRSYMFNSKIIEYNQIILELSLKYKVPLIDIYKESISNSILLSDGIHLNKIGHRFIFQELSSFYKKVL
jgi:lysophospholipase L1-like esterase